MPLVAWLVGAYLAGLLLGFSAAGFVIAIAGGGAAAIAGPTGRTRIATTAVLIAAGSVAAMTSAEGRRECVRQAVAAGSHVARIVDDAGPGGFVRARARCGARVNVFVAKGRAAAGSVVRVRGEVSATSDSASLTVRAATITVLGAPRWTERVRAAGLRSTDRDFGADAPLVRALVLADMGDMSPEIKDSWSAAGMVHMLSVSGLHVGIIAAVVELVLIAMRVSRRNAPVIAVALIVVYVAIIGAPAPAVRSALMLGLLALTRMAQRRVSGWAILALGAAHPVIAPEVVLDLGYQLSVVGVAALIAAGHLVKRIPIPKQARWSKEIVAGVVTTVVATIASLPLVAWSMGRVSLIAVVSNLAAGPFVAAVQPMLFLGVLLAPFPGAAQFVADAAHPLLAAMNGIAALSAAVPGATITVWPTTLAAVLSAVVAIAVMVACIDRHSLRPLTVAAAALALLAWMPAPRGGRMTELHMIDVGQGDAVALRTRGGRWVLFDAGRVWNGGDAGRRTIVPYIAHRGGTLAAFVLSHPHADHVGGAASVIEALRPAHYVDAAFVTPSDAYRKSLVMAKTRGADWRRVRPGDSLVVDEATIVFLAPDSAFAAALPDPNNASTVALVRVGEVRMLMMGDAEREEEDWLLRHAPEWLRADVLKVAHHGSSTSSSPAFLDAVNPRIALVSVGTGNTYGHPSLEIMQSLAARGAEIARTDRLGTVVVETDGRIARLKGR